MPANLLAASVAPGTVLPKSLSTSFVMMAIYPVLSVSYNDGTRERLLIRDGLPNPARPLRSWVLAKRLTTPQLTALWNFWNNNSVGGLNPFYFYDPLGVVLGQKIGSNFDATGANTQGRVTCFFRGDWGQHTELGRHVIPNLTLIEVA